MTRLHWELARLRSYEIGVDRGVLYPSTGPGVAWGGLVKVDSIYSGQQLEESYFDGRKFQDSMIRSTFSANITAFSAPKEFSISEGRIEIAPGLYATHQLRRPFGFSFRTLIGNPTEGLNYGYKLHFVYNALAFPASRSYRTIGAETEPLVRQWRVETKPYYDIRDETGASYESLGRWSYNVDDHTADGHWQQFSTSLLLMKRNDDGVQSSAIDPGQTPLLRIVDAAGTSYEATPSSIDEPAGTNWRRLYGFGTDDAPAFTSGALEVYRQTLPSINDPEEHNRHRPASHMMVSSRSVSPQDLATLEDILYGTDLKDPALPTPNELIEIVRGSL